MASTIIEADRYYGALFVHARVSKRLYRIECMACGNVERRHADVIKHCPGGCSKCAGYQRRKRDAYAKIGCTRGSFTITDVAHVPDKGRPLYECMCGYCGEHVELTSREIGSWRDCGCGTGHRGKGQRTGVRGDALIDIDEPYENDIIAQSVVQANPEGTTLETIASLTGRTREAVRQLEMKARDNFIKGLEFETGIPAVQFWRDASQRQSGSSPIAECEMFADWWSAA